MYRSAHAMELLIVGLSNRAVRTIANAAATYTAALRASDYGMLNVLHQRSTASSLILKGP